MGDDTPGDGEESTEYAIRRIPDLQTVSKGAKIRYVCEWQKAGKPPEVAGGTYWGSRDGIRWYLYSAKSDWLGRHVKQGPIQNDWTITWDDDPGQYVVIARILQVGSPSGTVGTLCHRPQTVGDAGAILSAPLDALINKGQGPSPDDAQREIDRFRKLLGEVAQKTPPRDAAKHKEAVDRWDEISGRLKGLLAPSAGKRRIRMRAVHLDAVTQQQNVLMLFLTEIGTGTVHGRFGGPSGGQRVGWSLVDWTDPGNPRFRGSYAGEGTNVLEAVNACFTSWDADNRYPAGHVSYEIPPELYPLVGGNKRRQMDTSGKTITDRVIDVLGWIAVGTLFVAGFCFIFVGVPLIVDAAIAASMLAGTGAATLSIGQRWRAGIFDWKADAIDGLTIASNIIGAGAWARGALVKTLTSEGKAVDYIFIGARVGADGAQGVLIAATSFDEIDKVSKDPSLSPEERSRRLLALIAQLGTTGLLTALSIRAAAKDADALKQEPKYLSNDPRSSVPDEKLAKLVDPSQTIDTTKPPVVEGHTTEPPPNPDKKNHKTQSRTPVRPAPRKLNPDETAFAKKYPRDGHPWREHVIADDEINLVDKDGFVFNCHLESGGVLHVDIIVTKIDPATTSEHLLRQWRPRPTAPKASEVLYAKELYPLAYKHFEQIGKPVQRVRGEFAWDNYAAIKKKYVELLGPGANPTQAVKDQAAKDAVRSAKSYPYHAAQGLSKVTEARDDELQELFYYWLDR
jgi:hypothetical protein